MVELLRRYSNRQDLLEPLRDVLRRIAENDQTDEPGLPEPPEPRQGRTSVADRLGDGGSAALVELFRRGATQADLAEQYGLSISTVKRILPGAGAHRREGTA